MDPVVRDQLLARFNAYLDQAAESPTMAQPKAPDLFALLAELSGLRNEVKIESRQVKAALDQFRELFETLRLANERLNDERQRQRQRQREEGQRARLESERGLLLDLVELRDRLQAGRDQAQRYRPGWLARRGGADAFVAGMAEGLVMNLRRLDEILARHGVQPLSVVGQPFDPRTMQAVEVVCEARRADGEVLRESRKGFQQHERLLRFAEVVVNKRSRVDPAGVEPNTDPRPNP